MNRSDAIGQLSHLAGFLAAEVDPPLELADEAGDVHG